MLDNSTLDEEQWNIGEVAWLWYWRNPRNRLVIAELMIDPLASLPWRIPNVMIPVVIDSERFYDQTRRIDSTPFRFIKGFEMRTIPEYYLHKEKYK